MKGSRARKVTAGVAGIVVAAGVVLALQMRGRADAPPGRYSVAAETVLDNETGLLWQRTVPATSYGWVGANAYCEGLTLAGDSSWRLPTIKELETLIDERKWEPAIDPTAFPSTPAYYHWSSTPRVHIPYGAWMVDFRYGSTWCYGINDIAGRVRCVR